MRTTRDTRRQKSVELALSGRTPAEIASELRISERSIRRYLAAPESREALRSGQDERLRELARRALAHGATALSVLRAVADDTGTPPAARVAAARSLLAAVVRLMEVADISERLAELERALGEDHGGD